MRGRAAAAAEMALDGDGFVEVVTYWTARN